MSDMNPNGVSGFRGTVSKPITEMNADELRVAYADLLESKREVTRQKDELFQELKRIHNTFDTLLGR